MYPLNTKFLIVDDYATMRKVIKKVLADMGYKNIVEANNGQEALEILETHRKTDEPIEFIFSDWNMPIMMGVDFLRQCKKMPEYKSLPFILITAEGEQRQVLEAVKAGVNDYLIKPFSPQKIKEKMERIYNKVHLEKKVG